MLLESDASPLAKPDKIVRNGLSRNHSGTEVLVLYLKCPPGKIPVAMRCIRALQIQQLEGSRPGDLWDLHLDEAALIVGEFAVAVRAPGFQ
jgi:hypothetical protein